MAVGFRVGVDALEGALEPVDVLVDECKIRLDEGGLSVRAVDPANVGMVDVSLPERAFERLDVSAAGEDGDVTLGIDLERLLDVLSMADGDESVICELDAQTRKLNIVLSESGLEYTLALIDPDSIRQEPDLPDLDLAGEFVVAADAVSQAITAADLCSDHIAFEAGADGDQLQARAEGDTDDVEVTVDADAGLESGANDAGDRVRSLFSLDYLKDMEKPIPGDVVVQMLVGDELPTKLRYTRGEASVENMLAPRIQSE